MESDDGMIALENKSYLVLLGELEAQLNEVMNEGGRPELVFNRRDFRGNTLEERAMIELRVWKKSSSTDSDKLIYRDELVAAYEELLFRIRGAIYTVNGVPIPGEEKLFVKGSEPVSKHFVEQPRIECPEEMAERLMVKYRGLTPEARSLAVAKELDAAFPCPAGEEHNPPISYRLMGMLISSPDEDLSPDGYKSRGKRVRLLLERESKK
ncbi:hypothetical protein [Pseudodesulfovibrio sp. zrk46]|uniref:hypothetical protein n=1 Tax=Pseudodesulfovibrio sp. zrk46 TaxID=2725288 RepID=UPI00144A2586|nr:hypothetical protein [Pseudodesulfovibrio sp. zrk46]QJB56554.1 hypothetical protein HFN16_09090 [Pseudodesulfovibrio sp. zrk46]